MTELNWKFNANTDTNGLVGIFSAIEGEAPCATKYLIIVHVISCIRFGHSTDSTVLQASATSRCSFYVLVS